MCRSSGFFSPVTKSWKTALNNISEHGWNKGRARGKSSNKTRDNQSRCCSLTSLTISVSFGFPSRSGLRSLSPQRHPAACCVPGLRPALLTPPPGTTGLVQTWLCSKGEGAAEEGVRWQGTRFKAPQEQPAGSDEMPGAKGACACPRQGGRLCPWHCYRRGLIQAHPTQGGRSGMLWQRCSAGIGVEQPPPYQALMLLSHHCTRCRGCSREDMYQWQEISQLPRYDHKPHYLLNPYVIHLSIPDLFLLI